MLLAGCGADPKPSVQNADRTPPPAVRQTAQPLVLAEALEPVEQAPDARIPRPRPSDASLLAELSGEEAPVPSGGAMVTGDEIVSPDEPPEEPEPASAAPAGEAGLGTEAGEEVDAVPVCDSLFHPQPMEACRHPMWLPLPEEAGGGWPFEPPVEEPAARLSPAEDDLSPEDQLDLIEIVLRGDAASWTDLFALAASEFLVLPDMLAATVARPLISP
jgi:hypothetical protein